MKAQCIWAMDRAKKEVSTGKISPELASANTDIIGFNTTFDLITARLSESGKTLKEGELYPKESKE